MYQKLKDFQITIVALILSLAVIFVGLIAVNCIKKDVISVTGSAFKIVKSDTAILRIELRATKDLKSDAYKTVNSQIATVKDFLIKNGIKTEEITLLTPNTYTNYKTASNGYSTNVIDNYTYMQPLQVKTDNVDNIKTLSVSAQELLDKGIDISVDSPDYYYSKLSEIKVELLKQASEDAKQRAKGMLSATGNNVGKISSVKMGVFQITPPDSTEVSDYGMNDTSSLEKKVTAVANVTFNIK